MDRNTPQIDADAAHRRFAADCFNRTWELLERPNRTDDETEEMILCSTASLWHWTRRADRTDRNLSIGHWQLSRVYASAGRPDEAMRHGRRSLEFAGESPFLRAWAHEAIARAALLQNDRETFAAQMEPARTFAAQVTDAEDRRALETDLAALDAAARRR